MTNLPKQFFVTGTDTDVGKTYVSVQLIENLVSQGESVGVMKPIAAGGYLRDGQMVNEDALSLIEASGTNQSYEQVNPYLFEEPVSPHILTKKTGTKIDLDMLEETFIQIRNDYDRVLVEGAGGWKTPLSESENMSALAKRLDLPVILIVGMKLGCLNHAQLTQDAIQQSGLEMAGWIANTLDPDMAYLIENIEYLKSHLNAPLIGHIPYKKDC